MSAESVDKVPIRFVIEGISEPVEGELIRHLAPKTVDAIAVSYTHLTLPTKRIV